MIAKVHVVQFSPINEINCDDHAIKIVFCCNNIHVQIYSINHYLSTLLCTLGLDLETFVILCFGRCSSERGNFDTGFT